MLFRVRLQRLKVCVCTNHNQRMSRFGSEMMWKLLSVALALCCCLDKFSILEKSSANILPQESYTGLERHEVEQLMTVFSNWMSKTFIPSSFYHPCPYSRTLLYSFIHNIMAWLKLKTVRTWEKELLLRTYHHMFKRRQICLFSLHIIKLYPLNTVTLKVAPYDLKCITAGNKSINPEIRFGKIGHLSGKFAALI